MKPVLIAGVIGAACSWLMVPLLVSIPYAIAFGGAYQFCVDWGVFDEF